MIALAKKVPAASESESLRMELTNCHGNIHAGNIVCEPARCHLNIGMFHVFVDMEGKTKKIGKENVSVFNIKGDDGRSLGAMIKALVPVRIGLFKKRPVAKHSLRFEGNDLSVYEGWIENHGHFWSMYKDDSEFVGTLQGMHLPGKKMPSWQMYFKQKEFAMPILILTAFLSLEYAGILPGEPECVAPSTTLSHVSAQEKPPKFVDLAYIQREEEEELFSPFTTIF